MVIVQLSWLNGRVLAAQAKCPGFDSRRLPAFSLSSIFASKHLNSLDSNVNSKPSEALDHSGSKCQIVAVHF